MLNFSLTMGLRTTSVRVVMAPISRPPFDFFTRGVFDLTQVDDYFRPLDAVFQPVEAVEAARHHPGVVPYLIEQAQSVSIDAGWKSSNAGMMSRMIAIIFHVSLRCEP